MILYLSPSYMFEISLLQCLQGAVAHRVCERRTVEVLLTEGKQTADRGISRLIARIKKRRTTRRDPFGKELQKIFSCSKPSQNIGTIVQIQLAGSPCQAARYNLIGVRGRSLMWPYITRIQPKPLRQSFMQ